MSYVPRHSRSRNESDESSPSQAERSEQKTPEESSSPVKLPKIGAETEQAFLTKDSSLEAILDTDQAVREHPELADPAAVAGDLTDPAADPFVIAAETTDPAANPALAAGDPTDPAEDPALTKIRRRRWPITIAIILAIILVGGAVTYYVLSSQALGREANRTAGYALLDESIALIQESDQLIVSLDAATTTEVTQTNLLEREVLLERVPTTQENLISAQEKATEATELLTSADDKEFAQHVIDAATNRIDMLTSGKAIITKDIEAMNSALLFGQTWELIVNADTELRATTELSKTGGYNELHEAIERNTAVIASLQQASELLGQAQEAFKEADYSSVVSYVALKTESAQLALEADQAILNGDIDTVNAKNAEFGLKDAAVVDAASKIPPEPLTLITDAYEVAIAEERALYDSARANAADADRYIREYVGVETQTRVQ